MATNSIKIFDDTVIKLSVNQGLEEQRSTEILGNFTNGELAFTRDTARLFVGDNSDGEPGHIGLQQTVGGSLVGNKYLGLIDSKPLVTFYDNGEPLSFESPTSSTGTQELSQFTEQGLLVTGSKFRLHSEEGADEEWDNWDRTAVYNPKYNAYNGDFMYDVYQNALILFDTRISGNPESDTQPQIKLGTDGRPVEPETFIINNEEIPSTDERALNITRRSTLQNYSKTNDDVTNSELVYGDGYVVLRMVEPDNQTIRFKKRSFQQNGQPVQENNYTHNLLEIFHVPVQALAGAFSDDFIMGDMISLNKDIALVNSITGNNGNLKIPGTLSFSTPVKGGRGATTFLQWTFREPKGITLPTEENYKLKLTPKETATDNGKTYLKFDAEVVVEEPCAYTINLEGGLESDQSNPNTLVIDKNATYDDIKLCPTLRLAKIEKEAVLFNEDNDPYVLENDLDIYYTGNLGVDETGTVRMIDRYASDYYPNAADKIDKWEEENTSINFLRNPVTILQSSTSATLYKEGEKTYKTEKYTLPSNVTATTSNDAINDDIANLAKLATEVNKVYIAKNTGTGAPTNGVNVTNDKLTVPTVDETAGLGVIFTGQQITNKSYIQSAGYTGQVLGLKGAGTVKVFCALINGGKIIKSQERETSYKDFAFGFDLSLDEVLLTGTTMLAIGAIFKGATSNVSITYKNVETVTRTVDDEEIFTLSDAGLNVNVDFAISPYIFCAKKTVSCPYDKVLPTISTIGNTPTSLRTSYFNSFSALYNKTWNNLVTVLGHNHYKDLADTSSEIPMDFGHDSPVKNAAFKAVSTVEVSNENTNYEIVKHTTLIDGDEDYMAFSWYKEYSKNTDSGKEENVRYYPHDAFEVRSTYTIQQYKSDINFVKVQGNNTNLISNSMAGVITGAEEAIPGGLFRKRYAIYWDSDLVSKNQTYIEYGTNALKVRYDFRIKKDFDLSYKQYIDLENTKEVVFVKQGENNIAFDNGTLKTNFSNGIVTVDTQLQAPNNPKVSSFDYMIFVYEEEINPNGDYEIPDDEDEEVEPEVVEYYDVFRIIKDIPYVTGFNEPKELTSVPIVQYNNTSTTTNVTLDETVDDEDRVYVPTTARSIFLEVSHATTENNTLGIMYANRFEDLGLLLPGFGVQEYNNPATFSADVIINPSHTAIMTGSEYKTVNNKTKLKLGKSISSVEETSFHSLEKTVEENKKRVPSIYAAAPLEKILYNSSMTETRVIEVPLHAIPGTKTRHFALRFANIRPSNSEILNEVVVRVIGYRV